MDTCWWTTSLTTPADKQILADLFGECYAYHFGVNSTEPTRVENQACRQTQYSNQKPPLQGRSLCKPSPGRMSQTTCG